MAQAGPGRTNECASLLWSIHASPEKAGGKAQGQTRVGGRKMNARVTRPLVEADTPLSSFRVGWKACLSRCGSIGDQPPSEYPSPAEVITSSIRAVAIDLL